MGSVTREWLEKVSTSNLLVRLENWFSMRSVLNMGVVQNLSLVPGSTLVDRANVRRMSTTSSGPLLRMNFWRTKGSMPANHIDEDHGIGTLECSTCCLERTTLNAEEKRGERVKEFP